MVSSPPKSPLPGLQPHIVPVFRGKITARLPAQRLLLPLALIRNFSHFADRQIQETPDEVPAAGQPPRSLLVVFLAQMRLECFQGKEPSGRSQWIVVVSRTDLFGPFRPQQIPTFPPSAA